MRRLFLLVFLLVLCSCARRGVPPGGPVDLEPPRLLSSQPDSGATNARSVSELCMTFSEPMDKRSVRDAVVVRPPMKKGGVRWRKNTFCLELTDSLLPSTTYAVLLMSGCKDAHGNSIKAPSLSVFSTGDSLLAGRIRGKVLTKGLPAPAIPVWAYDSLKCPSPDFSKDEPPHVSQTGSDGAFELAGLSAGTYLLFAFKDQNANRAYDADLDYVSPAASAAVITPENPEFVGSEIPLIDPKEPGSIEGLVEHCYPESVAVIVRAVSLKDSTSISTAVVKSDSTFAITKLDPGTYRLDCFVDLNFNRVYDSASEPRSEEAHVVLVEPGETTRDVRLKVACQAGAEPSERYKGKSGAPEK